jgi:dTDP-D-glucose 4,6-dehydratase
MLASMRVLVTGGAGFIGRYCVRYLLNNTNCHVCNLDSLTYAADLSRLSSISANPRYRFVHGSTADAELVAGVLEAFQPQVVINLAAETHVDNSIAQSRAAIASNIMGTHVLLDACRLYWQGLSPRPSEHFVFIKCPRMRCLVILPIPAKWRTSCRRIAPVPRILLPKPPPTI